MLSPNNRLTKVATAARVSQYVNNETLMHRYIIMGVQGGGKGIQAKLLKESFDLVHISVGDIFRWHIQNVG